MYCTYVNKYVRVFLAAQSLLEYLERVLKVYLVGPARLIAVAAERRWYTLSTVLA